MYAVIAHGGKQYRVVPGEQVRLERMSGAAGDAVEFERVLLIEDAGALRTGPSLAGARVTATVLRQGRASKVLIFKKKRCKQYRKTQGHRQNFTEVRIERIS